MCSALVIPPCATLALLRARIKLHFVIFYAPFVLCVFLRMAVLKYYNCFSVVLVRVLWIFQLNKNIDKCINIVFAVHSPLVFFFAKRSVLLHLNDRSSCQWSSLMIDSNSAEARPIGCIRFWYDYFIINIYLLLFAVLYLSIIILHIYDCCDAMQSVYIKQITTIAVGWCCSSFSFRFLSFFFFFGHS